MKLRKLAAMVLAGALCLTTFAGCGVNPSKTAATLGKQEVSAGVVNFVCKYQKAVVDDSYPAYFGKISGARIYLELDQQWKII